MTVAHPPLPARRWPVLAELLPRSVATNALLVVAGAALTAICAQVALPIPGSPVPVTGQTFAVLMTGAALGPVRGVLSQLLYVAAGALGAPVFAHQAHGVDVLLGATGGYLVGFLLAATVMGLASRRGYDRRVWPYVLAVLASSLLIYVPGATWLALYLDVDAATALRLGVVPFLLGDALKAVLASTLLPVTWRVIGRIDSEPHR